MCGNVNTHGNSVIRHLSLMQCSLQLEKFCFQHRPESQWQKKPKCTALVHVACTSLLRCYILLFFRKQYICSNDDQIIRNYLREWLCLKYCKNTRTLSGYIAQGSCGCPLLEAFKARMDGALSNLV